MLDALDEGDGLAFGPAAIVAVGFGQESAMPAVRGFDISDFRVVQQLGARFR